MVAKRLSLRVIVPVSASERLQLFVMCLLLHNVNVIYGGTKLIAIDSRKLELNG